MHNIRERVRDSGSNANSKICFKVGAPSSTFPPSYRRIFTIASTQDFPHREPPLRIWANTTWEYTTPLSIKYNLSLEGYHNEVYNLVVYLNHKPISFSQNNDPNR